MSRIGIKPIGGGSGGGSGEVKISSNDTTAGYINGKLVAGSNITLTENNNGGNETLTIAASSTNNLDGGRADSVYLVSQVADGGGA